MIEVKSLPQLRFPEFSECWKYIKLGEVAHFSKGKNVSKDEVTEDGLNAFVMANYIPPIMRPYQRYFQRPICH